MKISVEISFYPLTNEFKEPVKKFINEITEIENVTVKPGMMSTFITGEYNDVMGLLKQKLISFMEIYPSVFSLKISNTC